MIKEAHPSRFESENGEGRRLKRKIPGVYNSAFAAYESPLSVEGYRASTISRRGTLEIMNQGGDQICSGEAIPRVKDSCSNFVVILK